MIRNKRLLLNIFLKEEDLFRYTENLRMYSKSSIAINMKHIYSLLTNLCGQDVYLMRI